MRKGGTTIPPIIIVPTRGLGNGTTTEIGAILTATVPHHGILMVEVDHRTRGIPTLAARQDPEPTKIQRVVIPIVAMTDILTRTAVIGLDSIN